MTATNELLIVLFLDQAYRGPVLLHLGNRESRIGTAIAGVATAANCAGRCDATTGCTAFSHRGDKKGGVCQMFTSGARSSFWPHLTYATYYLDATCAKACKACHVPGRRRRWHRPQ